MKAIKQSLVMAGLFVALNLLYAPAQLSAQTIQSLGGVVTAQPDSVVQVVADSYNLAPVDPADLQVGGTYWWVEPGGAAVPMPFAPQDASAPIYDITGAGRQFLVDCTGPGGQVAASPRRLGMPAQAASSDVAAAVNSQVAALSALIDQLQTTAANQQMRSMARAAGMDVPTPGGGGSGSGDGGGGSSPDYGGSGATPIDTNGLYLQITNVSNGWSYGNICNATNTVYTIESATSLLSGWQVEMELWPTNGMIIPTVTPFALQNLDRQILFLRAEDWTGVYLNGLPCWWTWLYFGNLSESATNLDGQGNTLGDDYTNGVDPNVINFTLAVTNNYVNTLSAPVQINWLAGVPAYVAVAVDDTNYAADANWQPYAGTNLTVNLGLTEGWHDVRIGLRGHADATAAAVWQYKRLKLDLTPPALVITSPTNGTVTQPVIQLTGYSPEALGSISYDLSNAVGLVTGQQVLILDQIYSTNTWEFTTNTFQGFDIPLTNGVNTLTLHATDLAGNVTTTNFSFTLDYSSATNPPVVQLYWPQDGTLVCNSNYTWRGHVADPTATITAQMVDSSGNTNMFNGMVERNGNFWVENLPLTGTNYLTLTVTDAAGNVTVTNITVFPGAVALTIAMPDASQLWNQGLTVNGTISDSSDYTVWVNGVKAAYTDATDWTATNVDLPAGGTALIQARAIPNSDNGGNGTGGSGGGPVTYDNLGNPDPPQDNDAESQTDKAVRLYVGTYTDMESSSNVSTHTYEDVNGNPATSSAYGVQWSTTTIGGTTTGIWQDNLGGYSGWQSQEIDHNSAGGLTNLAWVDSYYETSSYPNIVEDVLDTSDDDLSSHFNVTTEHCEIWVPLTDTSGVYTNPPGGSETAYDLQTEKDTGSRHAEAKMRLETGGKAGSGRLSLFCFSCTATQMIPRKLPIPLSQWSANPPPGSAPVPPQNITINGQPLGSDGKLWILLPDGTNLDVTPIVKNVDYFTFTEPTPPKYTLTITANTIDLSTNTPEFCVGQKVDLQATWNPALPSVTNSYAWTFAGDFVNHPWQVTNYTTAGPIPVGSVNYDISMDLLNVASPYAWWYSGGGKSAYLYETLHFGNGQSVTVNASGQFSMFRPSAAMVNPHKHGTPMNVWITPWNLVDFGDIALGVVSTTNNMSFDVQVISTDFAGDAKITQLCTIDATGLVLPVNVASALDGSDPYDSQSGGTGAATIVFKGAQSQISTNANEMNLDDAPGTGSIHSLHYYGSFNDYVMFTPGGSGDIYVPLGKFTWGTTFSATSPSLTINSNSVSGPTGPDGSYDWPVWTTSYP